MAFYKNTPAHQIDYTMRKTGNSHAQSMRAKNTKFYENKYCAICTDMLLLYRKIHKHEIQKYAFHNCYHTSQ